MVPEVIFIVINSAVKHRTVCDLTENLFQSRKRIAIYVADEQEGDLYNKLLWTWKQASFIPHKYIERLDSPLDEPVIITPEIVKAENYHTLLLASPAEKSITDQFPVIIDFADKSDQMMLHQSRERYKVYRGYQYGLKNMQPGEFFATEF